jgi:hypothetical protein
MKISPPLTVTRMARLQPGDLFLYLNGNQSCVAVRVTDPEDRDDVIWMSIGPAFPGAHAAPEFHNQIRETIVSFGKNYQLRLGSRPASWGPDHPTENDIYVGVTETGTYFCASVSVLNGGLRRQCFINVETGALAFERPAIIAYAKEWTIWSDCDEGEASLILQYPAA